MSDYRSDISNYPLIDDSNFTDFVEESNRDSNKGRGLLPRDFEKVPYGSVEYATELPLPLIPRSEWDERIRDMDKEKSSIPDLCDYYKLGVKHQGRTNYCWINAPVHCMEIIRLVQGQPKVSLSPASAGAIIKNYRNVGGWGTEGLKFLAEHGAVPSELWPDNAIDRRYATSQANTERAKYQADEWWEMRPRSFDHMMTCLFLKIPVAIGLNWWRHEVTAVKPVKLDGRGRYGAMIDNSWGASWGNNGRSVLSESKATPDDAIAPRVVTAS